jgi:two-component system, cell cycle sensor histidine kinase and response regulator CckA
MNMLNLNDLINAMEELHCPTTQWRRINFRFDPQLPPIRAEEVHIRHLISNMIAYVTQAWMEGDHELNLATRAAILSSHDLQLCDIGRSMPAGSYVELTVFHAEQHDSRQALPPRSLPANLDGITPILHRYQGAVCVQSFPHAGVKVYLPAASPVVAANTHIQTKSLQLSHPESGTILVIDDESDVRGVIAKMIERMGFRVEVAASGLQGIATIKSGISDLRVVLLDLSMAEMNGIEAAEAIQALLPTLPIILMSGYSAEDIHSQDNRLAIHSFIQKPFSYKTLEAILKQNSAES